MHLTCRHERLARQWQLADDYPASFLTFASRQVEQEIFFSSLTLPSVLVSSSILAAGLSTSDGAAADSAAGERAEASPIVGCWSDEGSRKATTKTTAAAMKPKKDLPFNLIDACCDAPQKQASIAHAVTSVLCLFDLVLRLVGAL